ncbi:feruloyl-CoA synthase [Oceanobacter mangrovi]|uniref:feruloyl-CoA synthase n=1 Tax=Oceanobacter mangrovi TaxID=2862510 RepID=UPI001C8E5B4C|nr:feruloyl-CoA synthase [Oceanobacter mangrovi]
MTTDFHPVDVRCPAVNVEHRPDGTQLVTPINDPVEYPEKMGARLVQWAEQTPDTLFVAERTAAGHWRKLTYAETLAEVRKISQWLVDYRIDGQPLSQENPIIMLSGNSIDHLLLALAAMHVGIPYAPISPAYSTVSTDFQKLRYIVELLTPGLLFVDNLGPYRDAIDAVRPANCGVIAVHNEHAMDGIDYDVTPYAELLATEATAAVEAAFDQVGPKTIAKFLFTSGSTGMPKGVINTQQMICSNQCLIRSVFRFLESKPPVIIDWLPWNHTFGGNKNIGLVLYNGGTLYIDNGKPTPRDIHKTLVNLREIAPTLYFNVPKGYELLVTELQQDDELAKHFFSQLDVMFFAGAGLAAHVWAQLDELAIRHTGHKVPMLTGLGATETGPSAMFASVEESASGVVGVPVPETQIKLVPNAGKLEVRVKGPSVTPGYWREPEKTAAAYDEEGYYCLGDALKYIDENNPNRGFRFDGRVSEDFKLDTGTWVSVGMLRQQVIHHFAPYVQDLVIAGHNRSYLSMLVFPDLAQLAKLTELPEGTDSQTLIDHPRTREVFQNLLADMAAVATGSSNKVLRMTLESVLPALDAHEITDKGSINQRAVLENRAATVETLYTDAISPRVIGLK